MTIMTQAPHVLDAEQLATRAWFESLRDRICAEFEAIEREAGSDAAFDYTGWWRTSDTAPDGLLEEGGGGGGTRGVMKGKVFEKVGVNVSTVGGAFAPEFAKTINGASDEDPGFFATGISLVAHMANPHVPAVHMNTRFLVTTKRWFGGGADLNPPLPYEEDTADFHAAFKAACDAHDPDYYTRFKAWADDYFYIPHRQVHRGVGGIFYDHLGRRFRRQSRVHEKRRRGVSRCLPAHRAPPHGTPVDAGAGSATARMARALCRVQSRL